MAAPRGLRRVAQMELGAAALDLVGPLRHDRRPALGGALAYKIFFYFEAVVHKSTILSFPSPTCVAHPVAMLLSLDRIRLRFRPPVCMLYTTQYWE